MERLKGFRRLVTTSAGIATLAVTGGAAAVEATPAFADSTADRAIVQEGQMPSAQSTLEDGRLVVFPKELGVAPTPEQTQEVGISKADKREIRAVLKRFVNEDQEPGYFRLLRERLNSQPKRYFTHYETGWITSDGVFIIDTYTYGPRGKEPSMMINKTVPYPQTDQDNTYYAFSLQAGEDGTLQSYWRPTAHTPCFSANQLFNKLGRYYKTLGTITSTEQGIEHWKGKFDSVWREIKTDSPQTEIRQDGLKGGSLREALTLSPQPVTAS
jgi:hypothetical protein